MLVPMGRMPGRFCKAAAAVLGVVLGATSGAAMAGEYPERMIKIVVPFAAGGSTDVLARMIARGLQDAYGQPAVVENIPGASTQIATRAVIRSAPDGYTLLMATTSLVNNEHLFSSLPYDASKDLTPVVGVVNVPAFLAVGPRLGVSNAKEFLERIKSKAQQDKGLIFGSAGMGSTLHLASEWMLDRLKLKGIHSAYKGTGPASLALGQGEVDFNFDNIAALRPMMDAGKIKVLMIAGQQRFAGQPDVPTLKEAGLPDEELSNRFFMMAPTGTPDKIVQSLNRQVNLILAKQETQEWLVKQGLVPQGGSVEDLRKGLVKDAEMWGSIIKTANIKLE